MKIKLVVVEGKTSKSQIAMELPATIGRSREASLTISHPMISRRHCELFEREGYAWIRDNASTNGTIVDGKMVSEVILMPQALLRIGPLTFQVDYAPAVEEVPPAGAFSSPTDIQFPADTPIADTLNQGAIGPQFEAIPEALPAEPDIPQPPVQIDVGGGFPPGFPVIQPASGADNQSPGLTAIGGSQTPVNPDIEVQPPQFGPPPPSPEVDSSLYDQPVGPADFASLADMEPDPDPIEGVSGYDTTFPVEPTDDQEAAIDDLEVVDESHHFKIEEDEAQPTPPPPIPPHLRDKQE